MGRIFINPKVVFKTGMNFSDYADELKDMKKKLNDINDEVQAAWQGESGHDFSETFKSHISEIDGLIEFLEFEARVVKNGAVSHCRLDKEFIEELERSGIDERFEYKL